MTSIKDSHKDYYNNVEGPIGGSDRFEWVVRNFFKNVHNKKILEIGCGEGGLLEMLRQSNHVWGVDISESGVHKTLDKGIFCHHADASNETLPFDSEFFDVVITLETIEHVENPHRMLWEVKRILKEKGILLISIPGEKVYHPFIYPGLFAKKSFSMFLEQMGFHIERVSGWGQAPLLSHWSQRVRERRRGFLIFFERIIYFIGRKRNLFMRNHWNTPLTYAYCLNFWCVNFKKDHSRIEEVANQTTPK